MFRYLIIIGALFLGSCCKNGIEINKYALSDEDKASVPYVLNNTKAFKYSNGFQFDFTVTNRETKMQRTEATHCGDNYSTYEKLTVNLVSNNPELYITFEVVPKEFYPYTIIKINNFIFDIDLSTEPNIETITLSGKNFNNIYSVNNPILNKEIVPKQLLYSKEFGIIQITMTDNETFTINE